MHKSFGSSGLEPTTIWLASQRLNHCSRPRLQQFLTGPYSEPHESSPHHHTLSLKFWSNTNLPSTLLSSSLFLSIAFRGQKSYMPTHLPFHRDNNRKCAAPDYATALPRPPPALSTQFGLIVRSSTSRLLRRRFGGKYCLHDWGVTSKQTAKREGWAQKQWKGPTQDGEMTSA
jgi:hypothetical protein